MPKLPCVSQISCEGTTGGKELSPSGQQAAELRVVFEGLLLRLFLKIFFVVVLDVFEEMLFENLILQ